MKPVYTLLLGFLLLVTAVKAQTDTLSATGFYQGKNIYWTQMVGETCTTSALLKVIVNGKQLNLPALSSANEIRLNDPALDFHLGDSISITLIIDRNCFGRVLNPLALMSTETYKVSALTADENGLVTWQVPANSPSTLFFIEVYRWNKWVKAGEVQHQTAGSIQQVSCSVALHSGENKLRVTKTDLRLRKDRSNSVVVTSTVLPVEFTNDINADRITFTETTMYEVYDPSGNMVLRGTADFIDTAKLEFGPYYLNYDTSNTKILVH